MNIATIDNAKTIADVYRKTDDDADQAFTTLLTNYGSHQRIEPLLEFCHQMPSKLSMSLFKRVWPSCDDTLDFSEDIEVLINTWEGEADFRDILSHEESIWFEKLPDPFRVYRGCDATRITGLSWTTSRPVAQVFAFGHRGLCHRDPVVITGLVRKEDALLATDDRHEQEVLVKFDCIKVKRISSYRRNARGVYSSRY